MKTLKLFLGLLILSSLYNSATFAGQNVPVVPDLFGINPAGITSAAVCGRCHKDIYDTWSTSMHFQSYSDPVFQAAVLSAQVKKGESIRKYCLRCHAPFVQLNNDYDLERGITMEGVSCDFCHSIIKVNLNNMEVPYEFNVGAQKYGPIKDASSPAHYAYYSELHTKSVFCAGCHQLINDHGVLIMGTYTEWSESVYAESEIHCQNCHMPIEFDLNVVDPKIKKVDHYVTAHRFQGGRSQIKIKNAAKLKINVTRRDSTAVVYVEVTNAESGHKLPTGTPARKVILEVSLEDDEGNTIGEASKVYRKTLVDKDGYVLEDNASQILDAVAILEDNRIAPKETRKEKFTFDVPEDVQNIHASAVLNYNFETPILQIKTMVVEMAKATDSYILDYSKNEGITGLIQRNYFSLLIVFVFLILIGFIIFYAKKKSYQ